MTSHQHIFIGGIHRSGTSPLARALSSHPQISGLAGTGAPEDEGQHLQDVYPMIRKYGGMNRFAYADEAHLTESSPLVSADNSRRLFDSWAPYWDLALPYLLEKSPSNIITTRFLQALFPNSWFIVIVRHPVVAALAIQKWNPYLISRKGRWRASLAQAVRHWEMAHSILRADSRHIRRLHILRYEDLIRDPEGEFGRVGQFLGLECPIDSSLIAPGHDDEYFRAWEAMKRGGPLARRQRAAVVQMDLPQAAAFGYDLDDLTSRGP